MSQNNIFDQIESAYQAQNKFVKIEAGKSVVLNFDPNKLKLVDRKFQDGRTSKAVEYIVTNEGGNEKVLTLSMSWALALNDLLKRGKTKIEVMRRGMGLDTTYTFIPV